MLNYLAHFNHSVLSTYLYFYFQGFLKYRNSSMFPEYRSFSICLGHWVVFRLYTLSGISHCWTRTGLLGMTFPLPVSEDKWSVTNQNRDIQRQRSSKIYSEHNRINQIKMKTCSQYINHLIKNAYLFLTPNMMIDCIILNRVITLPNWMSYI